MKILLDPQIFNEQKFGGISKYYSEIYKELTKKAIDIQLPLLHTENLHIKDFIDNRELSFYKYLIKKNIFRKKLTRKIKQKNAAHGKREIERTNYDLFIPTYYNPYFINTIGSTPYVLTVYDMIHELFPQYFPPTDRTSENKKLLLANASEIIAVSNNTKNDILKFFPEIPEHKVTVIYHGFSHEADRNVSVKLPERFVLFVGNRESYKNFDFLLESIEAILRNDKNLFLVCAGGNQFTQYEKQRLKNLKIEEQVIQRNFLDTEINSYYQQALCFIFPSIYEGFGIPIMESMINNCPIILTNNSCFPEVAREAALYYKLHDKSDLKDKIKTFVYNELMRKEYASRGAEHVKQFTWQKAANECLAVYSRAITETAIGKKPDHRNFTG